jgi:hypothetical protein
MDISETSSVESQRYLCGLPRVFPDESATDFSQRAKNFANTKTISQLRTDLKKMDSKLVFSKNTAKAEFVDAYAAC